VFEHLVSYHDAGFTLTGDETAIKVPAQVVSWDLFDLLRVKPAAGRGFLPEDETPGVHVAVLSHRLWHSRFAADPSLIWRTISMDRKLFSVVGVALRGFQSPPGDNEVQIWIPLSEDAQSEFTPITQQRGAKFLVAMGRLKPGISPAQAQAQMDSIAAGLARQY